MKQGAIKQVLAGCVLLIILGVAGFLYRFAIENPHFGQELASGASSGANGTGASAACTQDAKICPDGSAVGRTGPNCSFATCPFPNVQLSYASTTISFVLPDGYKNNVVIKDTDSYIGSYIQSQEISPSATTTNGASIIDVYAFPISQGQTPSSVMLANTYFGATGQQATSTAAFTSVTIGSNTFYEITTQRSNGTVQSIYYLYQPTLVLSFTITEKGVQNWNDPSLDPDTLPQHQALKEMLATFQVSE